MTRGPVGRRNLIERLLGLTPTRPPRVEAFSLEGFYRARSATGACSDGELPTFAVRPDLPNVATACRGAGAPQSEPEAPRRDDETREDS